jgi:hypothetical protein
MWDQLRTEIEMHRLRTRAELDAYRSRKQKVARSRMLWAVKVPVLGEFEVERAFVLISVLSRLWDAPLERNHGVQHVFALGRAARSAAASFVVNDDDGAPAPPMLHQPVLDR